MSLRAGWKGKDMPPKEDPAALRDVAEAVTRAKDQEAEKRLLRMQAREMQHLDAEKRFIAQQRVNAGAALNAKEIDALRARHDRGIRLQIRRDKGLIGRAERLLGGGKRQEARIRKAESVRDKAIAAKQLQHAQREARRQAALNERSRKIDRDVAAAEQRHPIELRDMRTQRQAGFEFAVRREINLMKARRQARER